MKLSSADTAFSKYIRTRDKWKCQRCLKQYQPPTQALHCSHFQGRRKEATRFEPLNADAMCYGCHQYFTSHPAEHYAWQVQHKGQTVVDQIVLASSGHKKKSERPLEAKYWREQLKAIE